MSAAFSDVTSAKVPTVNGARRMATDVMSTTRPLAAAVWPGVSDTATDRPIGNRLPTPTPSSSMPTAEGAGAVDGHTIAKPARATTSAMANSGPGSCPRVRRLPSTRPPRTPVK